MKTFVGLSVTPRRLHGALLSERYEVLKEDARDLGPAEHTPEGLVAALAASFRALDPGRRSVACGIGVPGLVHRWEGRLERVPGVPAWEGLRLKQALEKAIRHHAIVDEDAHCIAAGECLRGGAGGIHDVICLVLGERAGGAVVMHGELVRGASGLSGTFGALAVESGPIGSGSGDGRGGDAGVPVRTLDDYASEPGLARLLAASPVEGLDPRAGDLWSRLAERAAAGDAAARAHLGTAARAAGRAAAALVHALDLRTVLVAGPAAVAFDHLQVPLRDALEAALLPPFRGDLRILRGTLGDRASLLGAAFNWQLQPHS